MSSSSSTPTNPPAYAVPAQTLKHFQSDPWTSSFLSLATHTAIKTSSRTSDPSTGEDAFIAHTIGSPTTIPYCLTLRKNHPDTPPPRLPYARFPLPATGPDAPKLTPIHSRKRMAVSVHIPGYDENDSVERARLYTAQLDVRYRKPVRAPGMAVVKAWCVARDGRKFFMGVSLFRRKRRGKGGGKGQLEWVKRKVVCAEAYGVWVQVRQGRL
ncbi:thioesterase [Histoplasma capsulatum H143]|uniref:Thioesterase n=1 Tax=Ajellomyces capsulatus (strain H143) TaxID=544712 RepID=C6HBL0_AJECH|nr:thioesterase [Histoplasma capsulatum H143]